MHKITTFMQTEIWKPIEGFENLYEVSSLGNVRSLDHYVNAKNNSRRLVKGRLLKPSLSKIGYYMVGLSNRIRAYVHRLVAQAFVPNPNPSEFNVVNHKDENPQNNVYTNLEWCTQAYNITYGSARQKQAAKIRGVFNTKHSKSVEAFNDVGEVVFTFPSMMEAHRQGFDFRLVSACCQGKRHTHKGLHWRLANA